MPAIYTICKTRTGRASFSKANNKALEKIKKTWSVEYQVEVTGVSDPSEVDEVMVGNAPGIPSLASTIYVDPETGNIFPYFTAKNKTVERDSDNALFFKVTVEYNDETGEETNQTPPADAESIAPSLTWSVSERLETAWVDSQGNPILLPTGTLFVQPVVRKIPVLTATITQFENVFDDDDLYDRLYHCNSATWTPGVRSWGPHKAMITDIQYESAVVPIVGDVTMNSNKVTYKIECMDYDIENLLNAGGGTETLSIGHESVRIRSDSRYLQGGDPTKVKVALAGQHMGLTSIYLKEDGSPHAAADQFGVPPHSVYEVQPEINYAGFLRV